MRKILALIFLCASMALATNLFTINWSPVTATLRKNGNPSDLVTVRKVSTPAEADGYEYGSATVRYNGKFYRFYCSHGVNSVPFVQNKSNYVDGWDYIRMRTSRDGATWSAPRVVLIPSSRNDSCACDPTIIKGDDNFWYLYYTGFSKSYSSVTFVARSKNIEGPYEQRYIGNGGEDDWAIYPSEPAPIFTTKKKVDGLEDKKTVAYGAGQASVVKVGNDYHFWFTDVSYAPIDKIGIVENGVFKGTRKFWRFRHVKVPSDTLYKKDKDKIVYDGKILQNWPRKSIAFEGESEIVNDKILKEYGLVNDENVGEHDLEKGESVVELNDFGDVKWNSETREFEMWTTSRHVTIASYAAYEYKQWIKRYVSKDGDKWFPKDSIGPLNLVGNVGMSGDSIGHIINGRTIVSFSGNSDSLQFNRNSEYFIRGCNPKDNCGDASRFDWDDVDSSSWKYLIQLTTDKKYPKDVDPSLLLEPLTSAREFNYPTLFKRWWNTNRHLEPAAVGLPWSTYQFTVGSNVITGQTVLNSANTSYANGVRYYQFPDSLKKRNLEFIAGDFDADGITDIGVVDRSTARWYIRSSLTGRNGASKIGWGWKWPEITAFSDDFKIVVGDFNGDGAADPTIVHKPSMRWFIYSSKLGEEMAYRKVGKDTTYIWGETILGLSKMTHALSGDYDGDGINDIGAVDCFDGAKPHPYCIWQFLSSEEGIVKKVPLIPQGKSNEGVWHGMSSEHVVLEGDFDGDGITDPTIWHKTKGWSTISSRTWWFLYDPNLGKLDNKGYPINDSHGNQMRGEYISEYPWGASPSYVPIVGDYNGDGMGDMSMVNMENFNWYVAVTPPASVGYFRHELAGYFKKFANPQIFVGDFDGDGVSDCAMGDAQNARVYFYTSSFGDKPIEKTISPMYQPFTGALYKAQFVPVPSVDEEKPQVTPVITKSPKLNTQGLTLTISDMELGSDVRVFNMIGQNIIKEKADFAEKKIQLPSKGMYIVRVGSQSSVINVK